MKRTFITNLLLLIGLNLLVKPFYLLVVETEIQNRVGAEAFGNYFALVNFSFILNILIDLGTTNWNTRHTAQNGQIAGSQFSGMIGLRLLLAAGYLVISIVIGLILHYTAWQMWILVILALNQVLASGILYLRSYLAGLHLFRQDSVISILDRLLLTAAMSLLLWSGITGEMTFRLEWLVWGQTLSYGITLATALILVLRKTGKLRFHFDKKFISSVLKQGVPFTIMSFFSMVAYKADGVMLERMGYATEAGIYAMCYRFYEAVNMFAYLFAVPLLPMFARMLKKNEDISGLLQLSFKVLFSGVFVVAVTVFFFGEHILSLVYKHHITEATPVFSWLMASMVCFALQYIFGTLITAAGDMRPLIFTALGAVFYNILLNSFYIPEMGALGAAKVSCFTQLIVLTAQIGVAHSRFRIGDFRPTVLRVVFFSIACILGGIFFSTQAIIELTTAYKVGFFLLFSLVAVLVTKMLDLRRFIELVRPGG